MSAEPTVRLVEVEPVTPVEYAAGLALLAAGWLFFTAAAAAEQLADLVRGRS